MALKYRELERVVKGFANHRRIQILEHLELKSELSLSEVSEQLKIHFKTASQHIQRLVTAGLVIKRNDASAVRHKVTKRGQSILKFLRTIE